MPNWGGLPLVTQKARYLSVSPAENVDRQRHPYTFPRQEKVRHDPQSLGLTGPRHQYSLLCRSLRVLSEVCWPFVLGKMKNFVHVLPIFQKICAQGPDFFCMGGSGPTPLLRGVHTTRPSPLICYPAVIVAADGSGVPPLLPGAARDAAAAPQRLRGRGLLCSAGCHRGVCSVPGCLTSLL